MPITFAKYRWFGIRHCYIEYNNAGTIAFKRVWLTNKCDIKINNASLEFSGDGKKLKKNYGYQASGLIEAAADDNQIDQILFGISQVAPLTGGTPDDFSSRFVHGTDAEMATTYVGLRVTLDGDDADTGAAVCQRFRFLRVQFAPDTPPPLQSEAVAGRMLNWDAVQAVTDVAGGALTGVPTRGAFWVRDILTNSANFDPVNEVF